MEAVTSGNVGMKKTRLVDILKESSNDREERGKNSSILPSSPRSMISKWFSSIRRSRESTTLRSRLASTVTLSRNEGDGTEESEVESSGDKRTSVVASLTRVVPENDELDLRLKTNEQYKRRLKKVNCVKLPRLNFSKKAESADDPLSVAVHRTEDILMLSAVETDERTGPFLKNFDEKNSIASCSKSTQTLMPSGAFPGGPLFGFGFGVGLAFLLSYRNEYNKMVELQRQMEILLEDIKNEMRQRDVSACSRKPQPHSFVATDSNIQYDQLSKLDSTSDSTRLHEINQLEAELEAELEFLQLNLESESTEIPSQQCIELQVAETSSAAAENLSESFGEEDHQCADVYSVCPYELERKLFELLQTRQEEHTEELDFALERAQSKLPEKEMEVSWWKENFHQHCPKSEESKYGGNGE